MQSYDSGSDSEYTSDSEYCCSKRASYDYCPDPWKYSTKKGGNESWPDMVRRKGAGKLFKVNQRHHEIAIAPFLKHQSKKAVSDPPNRAEGALKAQIDKLSSELISVPLRGDELVRIHNACLNTDERHKLKDMNRMAIRAGGKGVRPGARRKAKEGAIMDFNHALKRMKREGRVKSIPGLYTPKIRGLSPGALQRRENMQVKFDTELQDIHAGVKEHQSRRLRDQHDCWYIKSYFLNNLQDLLKRVSEARSLEKICTMWAEKMEARLISLQASPPEICTNCGGWVQECLNKIDWDDFLVDDPKLWEAPKTGSSGDGGPGGGSSNASHPGNKGPAHVSEAGNFGEGRLKQEPDLTPGRGSNPGSVNETPSRTQSEESGSTASTERTMTNSEDRAYRRGLRGGKWLSKAGSY